MNVSRNGFSLTVEGGALWLNDGTKCRLRVKGLPKDWEFRMDAPEGVVWSNAENMADIALFSDPAEGPPEVLGAKAEPSFVGLTDGYYVVVGWPKEDKRTHGREFKWMLHGAGQVHPQRHETLSGAVNECASVAVWLVNQHPRTSERYAARIVRRATRPAGNGLVSTNWEMYAGTGPTGVEVWNVSPAAFA